MITDILKDVTNVKKLAGFIIMLVVGTFIINSVRKRVPQINNVMNGV